MWKLIPPPTNLYGGYKGIRIGYKAVNYPKQMAESFKEYGWEHVNIEFDEEKNMIRLTPAEEFQGYRLAKHNTITARITKFIPVGRYMCFEENKDEILFIKYGS